MTVFLDGWDPTVTSVSRKGTFPTDALRYLCVLFHTAALILCCVGNSSCQDLCQNNGRCEVMVSSDCVLLLLCPVLDCFLPLSLKDLVLGSRCVCPPGFSGVHCQNAPSLCDSAPCLHGGQCVETDGRTIACICPAGYSGNLCEVVYFSYMFVLVYI